MKSQFLIILAVAGLAACGSSDDTPAPAATSATSTGASSANAGSATGTSNTSTQPAGNTFLAQVRSLLVSSPDNAQPIAVDSAPAESTDTGEPNSVS